MPNTNRVRPYVVTVHPEGRWWHIRVPELNTVSQALTLQEVPNQARDLISVWLDTRPETVHFIVKRRSGLRPGWKVGLM